LLHFSQRQTHTRQRLRDCLSFGIRPQSSIAPIWYKRCVAGHSGGAINQFVLVDSGSGIRLMDEGRTTNAVQRYLSELARLEGSAAAEPIIRALMDRSASRLHLLCRTLLLRSYPRLARPPLNLQSEELLSAVVCRLLGAMQQIRPTTVREFFALANRHMRWELNDLARRLDAQPPAAELQESLIPTPETSDSQLTPPALRILEAIESLPDDEREVFSLVHIQGMPQTEVAAVLGTSTKTVQRRLTRALISLAEKLSDLNPTHSPSNGA
jgi:RNA polymerase sigma-70 factor (ECF subfamily)